ncbi:YlcI/YnfO family protein [Streptococcus suis]
MVFKLKSDKKETEIKTIRFPSELVDRIEEALVRKDVSFSSFVIQACDYALNNMDKEQ